MLDLNLSFKYKHKFHIHGGQNYFLYLQNFFVVLFKYASFMNKWLKKSTNII